MKKIKKLFKYTTLGCLAIFTFVLYANYKVISTSDNLCFDDVKKIKHNKVGLVLGTSKLLKSGYTNIFFTYRVNAAVKLFKAGKVDVILISGDNGNKSYDEPTDLKEALVKKGIPASKIYLDYAGFRTLDSVVRAKEVFGLSSFTFISQQFHNERAIYIANKKGLNVVGFNTKKIGGRNGMRMKVREYFARTKAVLDIIFAIKPKFLGEKIAIQ